MVLRVSKYWVTSTRLNLLRRIGQLVVSIKNLFGMNPILDGNGNGDEYVVLGLRFHRQCNLIDTQADPAGHAVNEWPFPVQPRIGDTKKLSKSGDDRDLGRAYGKKAPHNRRKR